MIMMMMTMMMMIIMMMMMMMMTTMIMMMMTRKTASSIRNKNRIHLIKTFSINSQHLLQFGSVLLKGRVLQFVFWCLDIYNLCLQYANGNTVILI